MKDKLNELNIIVDREELDQLFMKFKELADKKKNIMDDDIIALVENRIVKSETPAYALENLFISYNNNGTPMASVRIRMENGEYSEEAAVGNGSIDAIYKAIDSAIGKKLELLDYKITSVTKGRDALGEVFVRIRFNDAIVQGRGMSLDILEASALAYIDAVNRIGS